MAMFGKVMFWLCVAIGVMAGGGLFIIDAPGARITSVFILGGMIGLGLLLRWIFSGGAED